MLAEARRDLWGSALTVDERWRAQLREAAERVVRHSARELTRAHLLVGEELTRPVHREARDTRGLEVAHEVGGRSLAGPGLDRRVELIGTLAPHRIRRKSFQCAWLT